jgi:hypothetical protein
VPLEQRPRRRVLDDVLELDLDAVLLQETPGVAAGRSGWLAVKDGLGHGLASSADYSRAEVLRQVA